MNTALFFESTGDERGTPQDFFDRVNAEFHFNLDAAASSLNHKCDTWFGEGGIANDALEADWGGEGSVVWLNPPYSVCGAFVAKAREEADKGAVVVMLLPVRSDTKWFHKYIYDCRICRATGDGAWRPGVRCRFLPGRLIFELNLTDAMRQAIRDSLAQGVQSGEDKNDTIKRLVNDTGLPRMAIEGIDAGLPDDELLSSAPFPSAIVIFRKVPA